MLQLPRKLTEQNKSSKLVWVFLSLSFNTFLVYLMLWLTSAGEIQNKKTQILMGVIFSPHQTKKKSAPLETLFKLTQAPLSAVAPVPPIALNLALDTLEKTLSIPQNLLLQTENALHLNNINLDIKALGDQTMSLMTNKITQAKPVFQIPPQYPLYAKRHAIEGFVTLDLHISAGGRVKNIKVFKEKPTGIFAHSAKKAVLRWRFLAPKSTQWQRITIRYELEK